MGRYKVDLRKGFLGSAEEITACGVQMVVDKIGDKHTIWLQRPQEHIKFSIADILPRILLESITAEEVIINWGGTLSRYITPNPMYISTICELGIKKVISKVARYGSSAYSSFIMNMLKWDQQKQLLGIILVTFIIDNAPAHHAIVLVLFRYDEDIIRLEMNRWEKSIVNTIAPSLVWEYIPIAKLRYFF
jgi:hypothetical protein